MKRKVGCSLIRVEMHPQHANSNIVNGKMHIFGGAVMSFMDTAAASAARSICRNRVVTISFDKIIFKKPVFVGDTLECYGEVIEIGKTSMTVHVSAFVLRQNETIHVAESTAKFVSVDETIKPIPVIGWDFKRPRVKRSAKSRCNLPDSGTEPGTKGAQS